MQCIINFFYVLGTCWNTGIWGIMLN